MISWWLFRGVVFKVDLPYPRISRVCRISRVQTCLLFSSRFRGRGARGSVFFSLFLSLSLSLTLSLSLSLCHVSTYLFLWLLHAILLSNCGADCSSAGFVFSLTLSLSPEQAKIALRKPRIESQSSSRMSEFLSKLRMVRRERWWG
jgi:hypothetical protein